MTRHYTNPPLPLPAWVHSFTDSDLPDTGNTVPIENTIMINQNKKGKTKECSTD